MTDFEIVHAMKKFGGSFVKCLAEAWFHADASNKEKLKQAFPEYWKEYEEFVGKGA